MFAVPDQPVRPTAPELEGIAISTADAAAALIRDAYGHARRVAEKSSPTDVVTQTDLDAEQLIRKMLAAATPSAGMVGEEDGSSHPTRRLQWIIDPLDGTVNFLYGIPIFAISIAAALDGEVVAGAVVDVLRHEMFSAHIGGGSRLNGQAISVSSCTDFSKALVATGFSYKADLRDVQGAIVHRLASQCRDVRCFGSAALEACWVACGRLDGYFERDIKLWDFAAGILIAREAGALAELPCPENNDLVVTSTPAIFSTFRDAVQLPVS